MHPADCPEFEYKRVAGYDTTLRRRTADFLADIRSRRLLTNLLVLDSRPTHGQLFNGLTPVDHPYFAGHYRGEPFRCLEHYGVGVRGDPDVGAAPTAVATEMTAFCAAIESFLNQLDAIHATPAGAIPAVLRLRHAVAVAAEAFEVFLRIHPYANGNGHAARLIVWAVLCRYGYYPYAWSIHPRPGHPQYTALIVAHRNGNRAPLQAAILRAIDRPIA